MAANCRVKDQADDLRSQVNVEARDGHRINVRIGPDLCYHRSILGRKKTSHHLFTSGEAAAKSFTLSPASRHHPGESQKGRSRSWTIKPPPPQKLS